MFSEDVQEEAFLVLLSLTALLVRLLKANSQTFDILKG